MTVLGGVTGIERHGRAAQADQVHVGLEHKQVAADGGHPLEGQQRIRQVIQHAEKQRHVENTDPLGGEVEYVDVDVFDA